MTSHEYRLRAWPELPEEFRTVPVLRALSRMTLEPVTHTLFLDLTRLNPTEAERLLADLIAREYVERIDSAAEPDGLSDTDRWPRKCCARTRN
jgi:hypothetical protein